MSQKLLFTRLNSMKKPSCDKNSIMPNKIASERRAQIRIETACVLCGSIPHDTRQFFECPQIIQLRFSVISIWTKPFGAFSIPYLAYNLQLRRSEKERDLALLQQHNIIGPFCTGLATSKYVPLLMGFGSQGGTFAKIASTAWAAAIRVSHD